MSASLSVDSFAQHGRAGADHVDPSLRRQIMARLFWECLVQTSSARVRPWAALPIHSVQKNEQSDIATRDRLARHSTGATPSFVPTSNVRRASVLLRKARFRSYRPVGK